MKSNHIKNLINDFKRLKPSERNEFLEFIFYNYPPKPVPKKPKKVNFSFEVGLVKSKLRRPQMLDIKITNEEKVLVTITPTTSTNKPATVDGAPTWTVQSGESVVSVAADGMSASLISSDTPGDTVILVEADADLGEGVETISDIIQLHVLGAGAKNLGLSQGPVEAKP